MPHAYFYAGDLDEGVGHALAEAEVLLGASVQAHPDVLVLRYGLFSVDDARRVSSFAEQSPVAGDHKVIVMAASRFFHEAQNALLKLFEEPPAGTTLMLILPSDGMLLPTLRSRLAPLQIRARQDYVAPAGTSGGEARAGEAAARAFLDLPQKDREKFVAKLVDRSKSDKDDEKQAARLEAVLLIEGLTKIVHAKWQKSPIQDYTLLLRDLERFAPIMHERSAPLKLIFEHLLIVLPAAR